MSFVDALSRLTRRGALEAEARFEELKTELARRLGLESGDLHIQAYRGYGTRTRLHLAARVLRGRPLDPARDDHTLWDNLLDAYRRFESDEVPGARVEVAFGPVRTTVTTDEEGYLHLDLDLPEGAADGEPWHDVELTLQHPRTEGRTVGSRAPVRVPGPEAEVGVISDVDDTVLVTGARSLRSMARLTFLHNARTRLPFAGVGALYRALEAGSDGTRTNPFFYVSSSPWNLYDLLVDFFRLQDLPRGVLLLRDLGLTEEQWVAGGHEHKGEKIEAILRTYPHLPFVLLGDSGQEDPEIYSRVAADFPGRIPVIYIRDVTGPVRDAAVRRLAERTTEAGTPMLLVRDSQQAARDAAARGLIAPEAVEGVRAARRRDETLPTPEEAVGEE
jgi:phosphatidate phosphatase APP1